MYPLNSNSHRRFTGIKQTNYLKLLQLLRSNTLNVKLSSIKVANELNEKNYKYFIEPMVKFLAQAFSLYLSFHVFKLTVHFSAYWTFLIEPCDIFISFGNLRVGIPGASK